MTLNAITLKFVLFPRECACCKGHVKREKMWSVWRYGVNKTKHEWLYCQECMKTAEDVLNEIDTDSIPFGRVILSLTDNHRKICKVLKYQ